MRALERWDVPCTFIPAALPNLRYGGSITPPQPRSAQTPQGQRPSSPRGAVLPPRGPLIERPKIFSSSSPGNGTHVFARVPSARLHPHPHARRRPCRACPCARSARSPFRCDRRHAAFSGPRGERATCRLYPCALQLPHLWRLSFGERAAPPQLNLFSEDGRGQNAMGTRGNEVCIYDLSDLGDPCSPWCVHLHSPGQQQRVLVRNRGLVCSRWLKVTGARTLHRSRRRTRRPAARECWQKELPTPVVAVTRLSAPRCLRRSARTSASRFRGRGAR